MHIINLDLLYLPPPTLKSTLINSPPHLPLKGLLSLRLGLHTAGCWGVGKVEFLLFAFHIH